MLIDSHCHLDRLKTAPDQDSLKNIISAAKARDIAYFLCVNVRQQGFVEMKQKMASFEEVFLSAGVHPLDVQDGLNVEEIEKFARDEKVVAIGETGLDYFYANETKTLQQSCFEQQIDLAVKVKKPLIIHTRDAREDTLNFLKRGNADTVGGVLHCFTESWEMAKAAIDIDCWLKPTRLI